jgi:hypothetical protein
MEHSDNAGRSNRQRIAILAVLAMVPLLCANSGCDLPIRWDFTLNVTPDVPIHNAVVFAESDASNLVIEPVPDLPGRVTTVIPFSGFFPFNADTLHLGLLGTYDNGGQTGLAIALDPTYSVLATLGSFQDLFQGVDEPTIIGALQGGAPQDSPDLTNLLTNFDFALPSIVTQMDEVTYDTSAGIVLFSNGRPGGSVSITAAVEPPATAPEPSPAVSIGCGLLLLSAAAGVRHLRHRSQKVGRP